MFIFVRFRAALHRVRTDQIWTGWFGCYHSVWQISRFRTLRLLVYDGINEEAHLNPCSITSISFALFILLSIDEDPEALEAQPAIQCPNRSVAGPGQHRE